MKRSAAVRQEISEWHVVVIHPNGGQTCYCFDTEADAWTARALCCDVMGPYGEVFDPVEWKDSDTTHMPTVYVATPST